MTDKQAKLISDALARCILASGIVRTDIDGFTGPQLLMFAADLESMLAEGQMCYKPLAAVEGWVPVTQNLLDEQPSWIYKPMWIALKCGEVVQGYYEWRQGRNPDRFFTERGDEWAVNAAFVMPIVKPLRPISTEQVHSKRTTI